MSVWVAGCGGSSTGGETDVGTVESAERWDELNDPTRVDSSFVYLASELPLSGAAASAPIPAYYWATALDSINYRWDGAESLSPAEKFGQAFGRANVDLAVSRANGIRSASWRKSCRTASDCADLQDGSACGIARGETSGRCIPMWWGICHGWAPYAISEPQVKRSIEHNGVTFHAADIEALMSLVYTARMRTKFLSDRCDRDGNSSGPEGVHRDETGRVLEGECRDMNPGSFHVLATNMLGLRSQSFVYDRTWDAEVWNQPVRDYRVTNAEGGTLKEISKAEAIRLVGDESDVYRHNPEAARFFYVEMDFRYIAEPRPMRQAANPDHYTRTDRFQYVLEADAAGRIEGGEWVGRSRDVHPDFAWWNTEKPRTAVAEGTISYAEVKLLNDAAAEVGGGGGEEERRVLLEDASFRRGQSRYVTVGAAEGKHIEVRLTATGRAELWMRLGASPTANRWDCRGEGSDTEKTCSVLVPPGGGSYVVRVRAAEALRATVEARIGAP